MATRSDAARMWVTVILMFLIGLAIGIGVALLNDDPAGASARFRGPHKSLDWVEFNVPQGPDYDVSEGWTVCDTWKGTPYRLFFVRNDAAYLEARPVSVSAVVDQGCLR